MSDREKAHVFLMALKNRKGREDRQRAVEVLIANIRASERRHAERDFIAAAAVLTASETAKEEPAS